MPTKKLNIAFRSVLSDDAVERYALRCASSVEHEVYMRSDKHVNLEEVPFPWRAFEGGVFVEGVPYWLDRVCNLAHWSRHAAAPHSPATQRRLQKHKSI